MNNVLGWIGSICFALCGLPQAIKCVRQGNTQGLSTLFLTLWSVGSVCYIMAVWTEFGWVPWMMMNYIMNLIWLVTIFRYRLWPRGEEA